MSKQSKIILFACMYIAGIMGFFSNLLLAAEIIVICIFVLMFFRKNLFSFKYLSALIIIFCLGLINTALKFNLYDDLSSYGDCYADFTAKVLTIPSNNIQGKTKFFAQVYSIQSENITKNNLNAKSYITITDEQEKINNLKIGDTLKLHGRLKIPEQAKNPSQFDYAKYLQFKNTFSLIYVHDNWQIIGETQDFKGKFIRKLNDTRNSILDIHKQNINSPMIEILGGIIFGDDAVNPDEITRDNFINSGIIHILAASGMNVTLIFGIWFFISSKLRFNYRFSIITGILLILFYTCMTGFGPPFIRGFLMLFFVLIGKLIDRTAPTLGLLFLVAFFMLVYNPLMIFDIGFQLSFIVTFGLILSAPLFVFNFKFKPFNVILSACIVPLIAQIFAAPLQLYYFNTFTVYSVFANIAIVPVLSIVSFVGFISSILALIPVIANKVCYFADLILNPLLIFIVKTAEFFSSLPNSVIYLKKPALFQLILYFAFILLLICILFYKIFNKKVKFIAVSLFCILLISFIPIKNNNPEIIFFSVGNADAALIKSPRNQYFLVDTGKMPYLSSTSQAKYIIIKYLKDKGIKNIHSLILSHFDADHAGGTVDILKELNVGRVYITDTFENTNLAKDIFKYIEENNINSIIVNNETQIYNEGNFSIDIIKPKGENIISENQKSLIAKISYYDHGILFMGDGDINSFKVLTDKFKKNTNIIKVGHHGAKDTVDNNMAENITTFILSTGPNVYNHPNPKTLEVLTKHGNNILRTDYNNAIKIKLYKNKYKTYSYSPKYKKFVNN